MKYVFPVAWKKAEHYAMGKRVVVKHRAGYYVTGIVTKVTWAAITGLVEIEIDGREV